MYYLYLYTHASGATSFTIFFTLLTIFFPFKTAHIMFTGDYVTHVLGKVPCCISLSTSTMHSMIQNCRVDRDTRDASVSATNFIAYCL